MTHAARTHEKLAEIETLRERLDQIERSTLQDQAQAMELALLLADLSSFMRELDTRNFSHGKRAQLKGLKVRLQQVRAA